jgi:hypothetical protein
MLQGWGKFHVDITYLSNPDTTFFQHKIIRRK